MLTPPHTHLNSVLCTCLQHRGRRAPREVCACPELSIFTSGHPKVAPAFYVVTKREQAHFGGELSKSVGQALIKTSETGQTISTEPRCGAHRSRRGGSRGSQPEQRRSARNAISVPTTFATSFGDPDHSICPCMASLVVREKSLRTLFAHITVTR